MPTLLTGWHHIGHISNVVNKWNRARNQCYTDHYSKHVYGAYNPKISIDLVKNVPCPLIHVYAAGSNLPQYPAAGPFTQLIYKNISVPVYTTLKGVSEFSLRFHICLTLSSLDANIQPNTLCVAQHHLSSVLFYFVCCRKPLRSAVCLCQMMTLGRRTIAALWPACEPPFWALIGREASLAARELSREVIVMDYSADGTEKKPIYAKNCIATVQ